MATWLGHQARGTRTQPVRSTDGIIAHVGPEALAVTTNAAIDFMRKPQGGVPLVADVELLKLGRGLAVGDVRIGSGDDLVARATLTYSRPRR